MDQISNQIPHLLQVYPSSSESKIQNHIIHISHPALPSSHGKVTYQQTITSDIIPVSSMGDMITQNIVMSCQQTHLQTIPIQSQVLQSTDLNKQIQITSHTLLPPVPVFKQQMLVNEIQQYYGQYEYGKECIVAKAEPQQVWVEKSTECKLDDQITTDSVKKKRTRSMMSTPSSWACNVRKLKHQRGEAYISRRGKYVPERRIKNTKDCIQNCKYKCNERICDADREAIFKAFYSLDKNEKKHYLLNTTQRLTIKHSKTENRKRNHSFKYFFNIRAKRYLVCKNFYLGTLAISQKPVYNVHNSKSDMNLPKPDGRGLSESSTHALPDDVKDRVRKHIMNFSTIDLKEIKQFSRKKQYLQSNLNIKKMYNMYYDDCLKENAVPVKVSMYRKIFKSEFNLHFHRVKKDELCCKCKGSIKKK